MDERDYKAMNERLNTEIVYGVKMTSLQNMMFSKYIANNSIAMNTKSEQERKELTQNWLNKWKENK